MKKLFFTIAFISCLLFSGNTYSQNYQSVYSSGVYYYFGNSGDVHGIHIENISAVGNDSIFDNYTRIAPYDPNIYDSSCINVHYPSWIGPEVLVRPNGYNIYYNIDSDSIRINTLATAGNQWELYQDSVEIIQANCVQQDTMTVLGTIDSVKVFSLSVTDTAGNAISSTFNNKQLILSQHNGWIKTYSWFQFPADTETYRLGHEGFYTWGDIYNFDVGDTFEYKAQGVSGPPQYTYVKINGKSFSGGSNTVNYTENITVQNLQNYGGSSPYWTSTNSTNNVTYTNLDSVFSKAMPDEAIVGAYDTVISVYPYTMRTDLICGGSVGMSYNNNVKAVRYSSSQQCFINNFVFEPQDTMYDYVVGYGKTKDEFNDAAQGGGLSGQNDLIYSNKGGNVCGSQVWAGMYTKMKNNVQLSAFPNPASNSLTIVFGNSNYMRQVTIKIVNVLGEQVQSYSCQQSGPDFQKQIDISTLSKGVYFIKAVIDGVPETVDFVKM